MHWRKILATTMQPETLLYGRRNEEIVNFLKHKQMTLKNFAYNMVLVCIYECPVVANNNDSFRQGKTKFYYYYSLSLSLKITLVCIYFVLLDLIKAQGWEDGSAHST